MNSNKLKGRMREMDVTQDAAAKAVGISLSNFNAKVNCNGTEFTVKEASRLIALLDLTPEQAGEIFFG